MGLDFFSSLFYFVFNLLSKLIYGSLVSSFYFNSECSTQPVGLLRLYRSVELNFLVMGLINCEFTATLRCRLFCTVAPLNIFYREVFFVLYIRNICRLWNPLTQVQGILYLSTYIYVLYAVLMAPYVATRHVHSQDLDRSINVLN